MSFSRGFSPPGFSTAPRWPSANGLPALARKYSPPPCELGAPRRGARDRHPRPPRWPGGRILSTWPSNSFTICSVQSTPGPSPETANAAPCSAATPYSGLRIVCSGWRVPQENPHNQRRKLLDVLRPAQMECEAGSRNAGGERLRVILERGVRDRNQKP